MIKVLAENGYLKKVFTVENYRAVTEGKAPEGRIYDALEQRCIEKVSSGKYKLTEEVIDLFKVFSEINESLDVLINSHVNIVKYINLLKIFSLIDQDDYYPRHNFEKLCEKVTSENYSGGDHTLFLTWAIDPKNEHMKSHRAFPGKHKITFKGLTLAKTEIRIKGVFIMEELEKKILEIKASDGKYYGSIVGEILDYLSKEGKVQWADFYSHFFKDDREKVADSLRRDFGIISQGRHGYKGPWMLWIDEKVKKKKNKIKKAFSGFSFDVASEADMVNVYLAVHKLIGTGKTPSLDKIARHAKDLYIELVLLRRLVEKQSSRKAQKLFDQKIKANKEQLLVPVCDFLKKYEKSHTAAMDMYQLMLYKVIKKTLPGRFEDSDEDMISGIQSTAENLKNISHVISQRTSKIMKKHEKKNQERRRHILDKNELDESIARIEDINFLDDGGQTEDFLNRKDVKLLVNSQFEGQQRAFAAKLVNEIRGMQGATGGNYAANLLKILFVMHRKKSYMRNYISYIKEAEADSDPIIRNHAGELIKEINANLSSNNNLIAITMEVLNLFYESDDPMTYKEMESKLTHRNPTNIRKAINQCLQKLSILLREEQSNKSPLFSLNRAIKREKELIMDALKDFSFKSSKKRLLETYIQLWKLVGVGHKIIPEDISKNPEIEDLYIKLYLTEKFLEQSNMEGGAGIFNNELRRIDPRLLLKIINAINRDEKLAMTKNLYIRGIRSSIANLLRLFYRDLHGAIVKRVDSNKAHDSSVDYINLLRIGSFFGTKGDFSWDDLLDIYGDLTQEELGVIRLSYFINPALQKDHIIKVKRNEYRLTKLGRQFSNYNFEINEVLNMEEIEKRIILYYLKLADWQVTKVDKISKVPGMSHPSLWKKIKAYKLQSSIDAGKFKYMRNKLLKAAAKAKYNFELTAKLLGIRRRTLRNKLIPTYSSREELEKKKKEIYKRAIENSGGNAVKASKELGTSVGDFRTNIKRFGYKEEFEEAEKEYLYKYYNTTQNREELMRETGYGETALYLKLRKYNIIRRNM